MSDLNMSITAEEQDELESKLLEANGGQLVLGYCSIASDIVSKLLTAQQKPASLEESLAILDIYGNCVKKMYGIDQVIIDAEKIKAYHNFQSIIKDAEEKASAQQALENTPIPEEMAVDEHVAEESVDLSGTVDEVDPLDTEVERVHVAANVLNVETMSDPDCENKSTDKYDGVGEPVDLDDGITTVE